MRATTAFASVLAMALLSACADPMDQVVKLSDVDLAENADAVDLRAEPDVVDDDNPANGLFSVFRKRPEETETPVTPDLSDEPAEAGGATPLQSDAPATDGDQNATAHSPEPKEQPTRAGLLGLFKRADQSAPESQADATPKAAPAAPSDSETTSAPATPADQGPDPKAEPAAVKTAGLLGFFKAKDKGQPPAAGVEMAALSTPSKPEVVKTDATKAQPASLSKDLVDEPKRRRLLKARKTRVDPNAPDAQVVEFGTSLGYGQVARVCGKRKSDFGREVARYPEKRAKYRLYDSAPGTTAPHTFYLTGFPDGCARQFTAALAVFGSAGMHEQLRYVLPDSAQPYSDTDKAYEKLKSRVCRVGRKRPCGAKLSLLEKDTVFLSLYQYYGGNARWANILLHDGQVLAKDFKGG